MLIGLSKSGMAGRILWIAILWLWAYVISATYVAKLIPLYGGISAGPARFATLRLSYRTAFGQMYDNLGTISLLPAGVLLYMTALVVASALALAIGLSFRILARDAY